jgi:hypothetical protein
VAGKIFFAALVLQSVFIKIFRVKPHRTYPPALSTGKTGLRAFFPGAPFFHGKHGKGCLGNRFVKIHDPPPP